MMRRLAIDLTSGIYKGLWPLVRDRSVRGAGYVFARAQP